MKFKKLVIILIIAAAVLCYFTKPSKEDFVRNIRPVTGQLPPLVEYQDNFLYSKIVATYIGVNAPGTGQNPVATGATEEYIGIFNKFWKIDKPATR